MHSEMDTFKREYRERFRKVREVLKDFQQQQDRQQRQILRDSVHNVNMDIMNVPRASTATASKGKQSPPSNTERPTVDQTASDSGPSYESVQSTKCIDDGATSSGGGDNSPLNKDGKECHSANIGSSGTSPTTPTSDGSRDDAKEKDRLLRHQQQRLQQLERTVHALVGRLEKVRLYSLRFFSYWDQE